MPTRASDAPDPLGEVVERVRRITRENEQLFARLIEGERRFRGLARAVWKVQEDERRRLARELHDGLGQSLTALVNQLERLHQKLGATGQTATGAEVAAATEGARDALREARELSRLLRPPVLDDLGLPAALSWLARSLAERTGLAVELVLEGLEERLAPDLETLLFRLVQEALTNVLRHAEAAEARVSLRREGRQVRLEVQDGGRGFDPAGVLAARRDGGSSGLAGMENRLELFGGRLEIVSAPGGGTRLTARVPLPEDLG